MKRNGLNRIPLLALTSSIHEDQIEQKDQMMNKESILNLQPQ